jgi:hypothetical protein
MAPFTAKRAAVNRPLTPMQRARLRARRSAAQKLSKVIVRRGKAVAVRTAVRQNAAATNTFLSRSCIRKRPALQPPPSPPLPPEFFSPVPATDWSDIDAAYRADRHINFTDIQMVRMRQDLFDELLDLLDTYPLSTNRLHIIDQLLNIIDRMRMPIATPAQQHELARQLLLHIRLEDYDVTRFPYVDAYIRALIG